MKAATNATLVRQQTGISDLKQSYIDKSLSLEHLKVHRRLCLIKHNSPFMIFWELVVATIFIFSFFLTPLNMALLFEPYQEDFKTFELIIDIVIIFDIIINFISETVKDVDIVIYLKDAAMIYLKSYFLTDLASIMPNIIAVETSTATYPLKLLRFIRIKRFFKFFQLMETFVTQVLFNNDTTWKERGRRIVMFFNLMTLIYLCLHAYACVWLYLGQRGTLLLF